MKLTVITVTVVPGLLGIRTNLSVLVEVSASVVVTELHFLHYTVNVLLSRRILTVRERGVANAISAGFHGVSDILDVNWVRDVRHGNPSVVIVHVCAVVPVVCIIAVGRPVRGRIGSCWRWGAGDTANVEDDHRVSCRRGKV